MSHVYVLCTYGEYGLERPLVATLDRAKLPALLSEALPDYAFCLPRLLEVLEQPDSELRPHVLADQPKRRAGRAPEPRWHDGQTPLMDGWGALQLLVLELAS